MSNGSWIEEQNGPASVLLGCIIISVLISLFLLSFQHVKKKPIRNLPPIDPELAELQKLKATHPELRQYVLASLGCVSGCCELGQSRDGQSFYKWMRTPSGEEGVFVTQSSPNRWYVSTLEPGIPTSIFMPEAKAFLATNGTDLIRSNSPYPWVFTKNGDDDDIIISDLAGNYWIPRITNGPQVVGQLGDGVGGRVSSGPSRVKLMV